MKNIKITLEYDGTNYAGWQIQPDQNTIQKQIIESIQSVSQEKVTVQGSSRTDAGVHARAQVANFKTSKDYPANEWKKAMNHFLPADIRVVHAEEVSENFHARFSAKGKVYRYCLFLGDQPTVFERLYVCAYPYPLDLNKVQEAVQLFIGKRDFASFSAFRGANDEPATTVRHLRRFQLSLQDKRVVFELEADGFLYKMVRMIVGTVLEAGRGSLSLSDIAQEFKTPSKKMGPCISPSGLILWEVLY